MYGTCFHPNGLFSMVESNSIIPNRFVNVCFCYQVALVRKVRKLQRSLMNVPVKLILTKIKLKKKGPNSLKKLACRCLMQTHYRVLSLPKWWILVAFDVNTVYRKLTYIHCFLIELLRDCRCFHVMFLTRRSPLAQGPASWKGWPISRTVWTSWMRNPIFPACSSCDLADI